MGRTVFSAPLMRDILSGASKYIKDGYLKFNRIEIAGGSPRGGSRIKFFHNDILLGYLEEPEAYLPCGLSYVFQIDRGSMELTFDASNIDSSPPGSDNFDEWNW